MYIYTDGLSESKCSYYKKVFIATNHSRLAAKSMMEHIRHTVNGVMDLQQYFARSFYVSVKTSRMVAIILS